MLIVLRLPLNVKANLVFCVSCKNHSITPSLHHSITPSFHHSTIITITCTYPFFGVASRSHRANPPAANIRRHTLEVSIVPTSPSGFAQFLPTTPPDQRKNTPKRKQPPSTHFPSVATAPSTPGAARRAHEQTGRACMSVEGLKKRAFHAKKQFF
jgi:hypothetical protein